MPVCPIVLALLVVSSALAAWALVALHRDPQRVLSISVQLRSLATLPVGRTFIALAGIGGTVTAAMVAVDDGLPAPGFCALLAFAVAALALLAVLAAVLVARFTRALWRGVIALCAVRTMRLRNLPAKIRYEAVVLRAIAVSRAWRGGLRAPPLGLH